MRAGTLLREARDRAGITQAALAARVGTTQSAIARIENGSEPTLARLTDLLAACGVAIQIHLARFDEGATDAAEPVPPEPWTPTEPVRRLAAHGVPFVLAGRAAASLHRATVAVEVPLIVPDLSGEGLERLASALDDLGARRRVPGDPSATLPFDRSAAGLRTRRRWELATTVGPIDVDLEPPGTRGYLDLARRAVGIGDLVVASARDTARQLDAAGNDLGVITHLRSR